MPALDIGGRYPVRIGRSADRLCSSSIPPTPRKHWSKIDAGGRIWKTGSRARSSPAFRIALRRFWLAGAGAKFWSPRNQAKRRCFCLHDAIGRWRVITLPLFLGHRYDSDRHPSRSRISQSFAEAVMVKTPRTRHSNAEREPVTIELGPDDVSRVATEDDARPSAAERRRREGRHRRVGSGCRIACRSNEQRADGDVPATETPSEAAPEPAAAFADEPKPAESRGGSRRRRRTAAAIVCRDRATGRAATARPVARLCPDRRRGRRHRRAARGRAAAISPVSSARPARRTGATAPPASVEAEIAALKSEIEGLKAGAGDAGDVSGRVDGLSQALDQVKTDVASLKQAVESGGAGENAGLEALNSKIAEIETKDRQPRSGHGRRRRPKTSRRSTRRSPASRRWPRLPATPVPWSTDGSARSSRACRR